jgi:hypothetical protein
MDESGGFVRSVATRRDRVEARNIGFPWDIVKRSAIEVVAMAAYDRGSRRSGRGINDPFVANPDPGPSDS